jgi:hypothetical protein
MKRVLFLGIIIVVGTILVSGAGWIYLAYTADRPSNVAAEAHPPPRKVKPLPDADVLAARMKQDHEVYEKVRDQALAAYSKNHPGEHSYDHEAQMALRLASYLSVWDDYYGEGLCQAVDDHAKRLQEEGCSDQVWLTLMDLHAYQNVHSTNDENIRDLNACENRFGRTTYPALWKLHAYRIALGNIFAAKADSRSNPPITTGLASLPGLGESAVSAYRQLLAEHYPHSVLVHEGQALLESLETDDATLKMVSEGLDRAFEEEDRESPVATLLDGQFYINEAWCARGSGYANTVTEDGWKLFAERLAQANTILTDLYGKSPEEPAIANAMMVVVLGQQLPRDQMELWFQRGVKNNPDDFHLYMQKRWYLLPRWYGSNEDVWNFGMECSQSTNWAAKIPLILLEAISDRAENEPAVYAQPAIWEPVQKVFLAYLELYPNSVKYRTRFVQCAVQGEHWDVAKAQMKILGDDWDRDELDDSQYTDLVRQISAH